MAVMYDYILDDLRLKDVVVVSLASGSLPDPLIVNNLTVNVNANLAKFTASSASIQNLYANQFHASTASIGNITANNLAVVSNASINIIHANAILASTATLGYTHISTIDWNLNSGVTLTVEGQMNWDSVNQAVVVGLAGGNVDVALGLETVFPKRVKNSTATTMAKGTAVYINGVSGNDPTVNFAIATTDLSSAYTIGLTAEEILAGQKGWITTFGEIAGLNLSAFTGGDTLYLSGATAGYYTNVPQLAPYHYVRLGTVVKTTADGTLAVNVVNGYEIDELHNVKISSLASGQILQSGASSLWYNRSLASAVADLNVLASLGSLAYLNSVTQEYLPSTASFTSLFIDDIRTGGLAVTSTASIRNIRTTGLIASNVTINGALDVGNIFGLNFLAIASTLIANTGLITNVLSTDISNSSNISTNTLYANIISGGTYLNLPSLGSLAIMNQLSFTSLTNQPSLSSLAYQATIDYTSAQLTNKPSLGSLAVMNQLSFTSLTNQPSLGSLAVLNGPLPTNSPASTNRFITAYNSSTGAFTIERPTWQNIDKTTSPINDLSDVTISGALDGQVLTYDLASTSWQNKKLPTQSNILENANHINNSTNGYGGLSDGWSESGGANTTQGGFPYLEWDSVFSPGATTAFWYLNEASGNAIDGKTGTYTLTDTNTVGSDEVIALMDYSRNFGGTNQRFSGTVALGNVAGSQTFVAFVRPGRVTTLQHICGYNDGTRSAYLGISATGKPFFNFTGTTPSIVTADVSCEIGKWYLIIGSYDSGAGELRIFVNGVYKAVSCTGTHVVTTNSIFQIGATNSANHFLGVMNAVAHYYEKGWDEEQCLSLFAVSIYKNARIMRENTTSEISCYQLLGREQMHRFANQQVIFSAEVYQTNSSNAKLTIYDGSSNNDSNIVTTTGSWMPVSVVYTFSSAPAEVYFNLRSSSGTRGPMYYRNIKLNYGSTAIGDNIHNEMDWIKFPRLLMLDIPKMFDGKPYQYEENKWYSWTPTLAPAGTSNSFTTEWRFSGKTCTTKGQIISTQASATWTHTLPIRTGTAEIIYARYLKIQNNAGTVALGNWAQLTPNSTTANMYSSIANAGFNAVSGVKVAQIEMIEWEID